MNDIADYADLVEERREAVAEELSAPWDPMHPPTNGRMMTVQGAAPEEVADALYPIKDTQDDSLGWVVDWEGMYDD